MPKNSIFYVRSLQLRYYKKHIEVLRLLFEFENILYNFCKNSSEELIIQIKLKWLYDELQKNDSKILLVKEINKYGRRHMIKPFSKIIDVFSGLTQEKKVENLYNKFRKFNDEFNKILLNSEKFSLKFTFSLHFQLTLYIYLRKNFNFSGIENFSKNFLFADKKKIDNFELVFIELFLKSYNLENRNDMSKLRFLNNLIIKFLIR